MTRSHRLLAASVLLAAATLPLLVVSCGGPTVAGTLVSGKQEFYNDGCDGLIFDARVDEGKTSILSVGTAEGEVLGSFVFDLATGHLKQPDPLVTDVAPPATSYMKSETSVCFQFGAEDQTSNACFQSLISNGAFCMKVAEEQAPPQ